MTTFQERLQLAIKTRGISQSELADQMGVAKSLITKYIKGYCVPKMEKFILLCKILTVSPSYLLGESEIMDDLDGLELVKFVRLKTPEVEQVMNRSPEENHRVYIYSLTEGLDLKTLEEIEDYIQFKKSLKK